MKLKTSLLCLGLFIPAASYGTSTSYYLVTTGQATANTQLDVAHERTWSFAPAWDWQLGGGKFTIKRGPNTAIDAILTLYVNIGQQLTALASVNVSPTAVPTSYTPVAFYFSSPVTLASGSSYRLVLTSATPDTGDKQYFIKGQDNNFSDFKFQDGGGGALPQSDPNSTPSSAGVPEPSSALLMICGLATTVWLRRRTGTRQS